MSVDNERRTNTEHKVTITVELADGTVISQEQGFNSGNPLFHAEEMTAAETWCLGWVTSMMTARYGDIRVVEAERAAKHMTQDDLRKFSGPGYEAHPGHDHEDCCK